MAKTEKKNKCNHTPGPWSHCGGSYAGRITAKYNRLVGAIATVHGVSRGGRGKLSNPEANANARLIAAAPEMLDALKWVRDNCTGLPAVARAIAEKAITKAEGRSQKNPGREGI